MAIVIPKIAYKLPDRDVAAEDNPLSPKIKQTDDIKYKKEEKPADIIETFYFFFENMLSMRCVTTKPPKIFMEAKITAKKPKQADTPLEDGPIASEAPTIITLEIAFVTAINGE